MTTVLLKSSGGSILQLITVLILFVFVLFITGATTKYIGSYQKMQGLNRNFEIIEAIRLSNNKYLQIVRAGSKYLVIAVGKDEVHMLTELSKEELSEISSAESAPVMDSFKAYLGSAKDKLRKKGGNSSSDE